MPSKLINDVNEFPEPKVAYFEAFTSEVKNILPKSRIILDELGRYAHGTDASIYRLTPKMVVLVETESEVQTICKFASKCNIPITFRAAGTSLSGQAVTDSVLVKLGAEGWKNIEIINDGQAIKLGSAVTGAKANLKLKSINKKIGPDPASINSAMIGGITANNSSGMCCGIEQNSYQTLLSMRVILADGTLLDTACQQSKESFRNTHRDLLDKLIVLGSSTKSDEDLSEKIQKKFSIKNTMGYSINALIDFEDPFDILEHLIIGSEGTLAFISEVTLKTVEDFPAKSSAIVLFPNIYTACEAVATLKTTSVSAVELMDDASLTCIADNPKLSKILSNLPTGTAGLLIDLREHDQTALDAKINEITECLSLMSLINPVSFSSDIETYNLYWSIRKGLFPKIGAVREIGTTVIIEDIAVDTSKLANAVIDLQDLFKRYQYFEAIIFGHALAGNIHFVFTQTFNTKDEIERYADFIDEMASLIIGKYDGSLKAEHSTGRNMAPYVEMEWGKASYDLMWKIKSLFDPQNVLNPGVILSHDSQSHIKNLKQLVPVHPLVDRCIECGFCENSCPSRALTLTPRQRIAAQREISRLDLTENGEFRNQLIELFQYEGIDSCAGDGLCKLACPVEIDTGEMMRTLRHNSNGKFGIIVARFVSNNFAFISHLLRIGLSLAYILRTILGKTAMKYFTRFISLISLGKIPSWVHDIPFPLPPFVPKPAKTKRKNIVYFSSCASRILGNNKGSNDDRSLPDVIESLFNKAGYNIIQPQHIEELCCGMPFESKGYFDVADNKSAELFNSLKSSTNDGEYPIIFDTSPCSLRIKKLFSDKLKIFDVTEAIYEFLLEEIEILKSDETIALHVTCSTKRMGLEQKLKEIAKLCSSNVIIPEDIQCCGFSGDKGFVQSELNENALRNIKDTLPNDCKSGYSTSVTCEVGLTTHSGRPYNSIVYLIDKCTSADEIAQ